MTLGLNSAEQIRYDNVMPDRFGNPILDYNRVVKVNPDLILKLPDSTRLFNLNVEDSGGDVEPLSGGYTFNDLVLVYFVALLQQLYPDLLFLTAHK